MGVKRYWTTPAAAGICFCCKTAPATSETNMLFIMPSSGKNSNVKNKKFMHIGDICEPCKIEIKKSDDKVVAPRFVSFRFDIYI